MELFRAASRKTQEWHLSLFVQYLRGPSRRRKRPGARLVLWRRRLSLFFYPIVLCMHFSPNFLPPHRVCEWVWVWVCLKMPGFRGNVSLAALKCLPYFISSKPSVNTLLGFIWSIVWRGMAKPLLGWLHCVCALVPRRKSRALSHYGPRVERNHYLILFGFSVYIVYVKDKEVLIYNI